jgi:hypothetical protein
VESVAPVPLAGDLMRAFIALVRSLHRKALSKPAVRPPAPPGA